MVVNRKRGDSMNIEIREDSVLITGYVNAVERYSRPITEGLHGKLRTFIERIKSGVFKKALKKNDDVKVLLNHDMTRELATTKDGSAKLEEDNIGLRAEVVIYDKEVIEKARSDELVGWSFGFYPVDDIIGSENGTDTRTITDLDLVEVSILDSDHVPAYYGTSIEARAERKLEVRDYMNDEVMNQKPQVEVDQETQDVELSIDGLATKIAEKILELVDAKPKAADPVDDGTMEDKACKPKDEKRDLSEFYQRMKNL